MNFVTFGFSHGENMMLIIFCLDSDPLKGQSSSRGSQVLVDVDELE